MESEDNSIDPRIRGIAENREVLLEALDVNHVLLTELSGHDILDECTRQHITSEKKYDINERFTDWLETRSSQTIDKVLQKLRDDKQDHVANLIDGTEGGRSSVYESLPMESEGQSIDPRRRSIAENREVLLEALDVNHVLLTELSGHDILDECTRQRITSEQKYDINDRFIDWLETRSSQTIDKVLQKLRDDKQDHLANLIDGTEGERPLSEKAKQRIRKLSGWLTKNMTTDHGLTDQLFAQEAISSRDCEDIKAKPTESSRVMELIDVVLRRSDRTFRILQEALVASNQKHIAEVVEKDEMIELFLRSTCKTADTTLRSSLPTDKDEEMQRKLKSISSHNFALAIVKATNDIIIYVLCEDGDDKKLLEELFESSQHRAVLLEELIKLSTSDTRARSPLESEVLQLIHDILPKVGHSGIVLQTGPCCGNKRELDRISDSRSPSLEKNSLETENNVTSKQSLITREQSHVVRYEEVVCDLVTSRSHNENEESSRAKIDVDGKVDLCKIEDTKATDKTESKETDDNMGKGKCIVEHEKPENHEGLAVDDKVKNSVDPVIEELQLKLKLLGKELNRKISEIACLHERLRQLEEKKNEINKDLNEILELNTGDKDRSIIALKQRERELEKEKEQLSKALKEAIFAKQQTQEEYRDLKEGHCKHHPQNSSLLDIMKETSGGPGLLELKNCMTLAAGGILNGKFVLSLCLLILRNTKSTKENVVGQVGIYTAACLLLLPVLLHLPVGIPDAISSFCFTNISVFFWSSIVVYFISLLILDRRLVWVIVPMLSSLVLLYLEYDGFGPGVGVGRYCQEDKCVYLFCWEYLSNNMRIGEEAVEQISSQNFNGAGGLFKSAAEFAVWNKYTSHRWDKEMREYTQNGRFIRKIYGKPLLGTAPFHFVTEFRLSRGLVSAGYGSLFYDDPMLKLCLLDANGNIIKSFGGQFGQFGVPIVLDADREGCLIVADQMSGRMMTLCSDEEHMRQLRDKVHERNSPLNACRHGQMFDYIIEKTKPEQ